MRDRIRMNHLRNETSPYLLQHAGNPVDWYPWGDEALGRARTEDKPILLSIGYYACHWCHVMAHESFENEHIARLMNASFVNIKVDREERPDIDAIYMEAVQSITGSGGWPLTVFLTPEGKPFYGGTYFPPQDGLGMPGFPRVLRAVSDAYSNRRSEVESAIQQIMTALRSGARDTGPAPLEPVLLENAFTVIRRDFDIANGGFRGAPKFPQPLVLEFLLRYYHRKGDRSALDMVNQTLEKMASGGIYDHLGGGFHRYSTDAQWSVPHFEKMLYDNALLSRVYLHAFQITKSPFLKRIAGETTDYVLREMTSPQGGFYTAQDADSEGHEGKYYTWTPDEIRAGLEAHTAEKFIENYGVTEAGNFDERNTLHFTGNGEPDEAELIKVARQALLEVRERRTRPNLDNKILVSWNGMMLASIAEAAVILERKDYFTAAVASGEFMLKSMTPDGHLLHVPAARNPPEGYLEDYSQLIDGFLNLHWATLKGKWLREAIRLGWLIVEEFWDENDGVFYDTSRKRSQELFVRPRNVQDGAIPSGSSAATLDLLKLAAITGEHGLKDVAVRSLKSTLSMTKEHPLSLGNWLCALDLSLTEPKAVVFVGTATDSGTAELMRAVSDIWLPGKVMAALDPADPTGEEVGILKGKTMLGGRPSVYVCEGFSCKTPVTDPVALTSQLGSSLPDE